METTQEQQGGSPTTTPAGSSIARAVRTGRISAHLLAKIHEKKAVIDRLERPRIGDFFANTIVRWLLLANVVILVLMIGILAWQIRPVAHDVILHYNAFFGVSDDMFGPWWWVYRTALLGASALCVNTIFAAIVYRSRERIASHILLLGSFLVQSILMIVTIAIVIVNRY